MDRMRMESINMTQANIEKIAALFPNCITETIGEDGTPRKAINFELLRQMLSADVLEGDEAYEFTWVGKKAAIVEANRPIRKTLRPCPEESRDWDTTENLYIEGDNLEVLKLLQESYLGAISMIYIDPPYNTGNDFIYRDDFRVALDDYSEQLGIYDEDNNRLFKNTDTNGRFHSDWCSMIYSRLMLARNLLRDDGFILISIDDNEIDNLAKICDEVFGSENCIAHFIWQKKSSGGQHANFVLDFHEYVLCYAKNIKSIADISVERTSDQLDSFTLEDEYVAERGKYLLSPLKSWLDYRRTLIYDIQCPDGTTVNTQWVCSESTFLELKKQGRIVFKKNSKGEWSVYKKQYSKENGGRVKPASLITDHGQTANGKREIKSLFGADVMSFPKPLELIHYLLSMNNRQNGIYLDFFSGSATTAHAVMQLNAEDGGNRKFIMVQLPETTDPASEAYKAGYRTICEIGKERIRRAGDKLVEEAGASAQGLDIGFRVFKLAETNMRDVYYSAADITQDILASLESNIKPDRNDLDLLFGCLLEWGLPLSMPYSSEQIDGCTVHTYNGGDLVACFDENIPESVIKTIAKRKPLRAVFRDSSFNGSPAKINVFEVFKLYMPESASDITKRVKVI